MGPLTLRRTLRDSCGISNFPVSVEYLTSSNGVPGFAVGAEKLGSVAFAFLPPKKNDILRDYNSCSLEFANASRPCVLGRQAAE